MRENIWKNIKLGFKTNKLAVAGAAAIILLALISIFAFLYPVDPNAISATERLNAPSMAHLFGTDDMGRDYLARCIYGGRASLLVGFLSMVLSTALGVIIGSISGFVGGTVDAVLMRLVDALMSLPTFLIMIVMNAFLKPGLQNIVLIIGFLTDEHCQDRPWRDHFPERERVCHLCKDLRTEEILHHCTSYPA